MRVLISGIEGFVATHLKNELFARFPKIQIHGFNEKQDPHNYRGEKYDYIFHLAAIARTNECIETATTRAHISNVELTRTLLNVFDYDSFIYTSSCAVYGNQDKMPIAEDNNMNPLGIYAAQKLYSENLIHYYNDFLNKPSVCVRLFNTYGPGQSQAGKYPNVLASLIRSQNKHGFVEVTGDGTQTRDFVYVSDVVEALILCMELKEGNHIFNVCSGNSHSINDLARMITSKIKYIPERDQDIYKQKGSYKKIYTTLGWAPTVSLEEGVKNILDKETIYNKRSNNE